MRTAKRFRAFARAAALAVCFHSQAALAETQPIAGAGPSTRIAALFAQMFQSQAARHGVSFEVPERSIKHSGGIEASNTYYFGRLGRPLNPAEKALGKEEILLGRVPVGFAVGDGAGVRSLTPQQLQDVLQGRIGNWKQAGGADAPIMRLGREPTEAVLTHLRSGLPYLGEVAWDKVLQRDHQVIALLKTQEGRFAIAFGMLESFPAENLLRIEGWSSALPVGLVYDKRNAVHPLVQDAIKFSKSAQWNNEIQKRGIGLPAR